MRNIPSPEALLSFLLKAKESLDQNHGCTPEYDGIEAFCIRAYRKHIVEQYRFH